MIPASPVIVSLPKVTAIVSTFASARFMRGCLDDLLAQTLYAKGLLEILVIDSGSPEDESAIVREYLARFPNIRLERTEREPLYVAWNRAIKLARGSYITNANTDDRHREDSLELLSSHLDANASTAIVYADSLVTTKPNETWNDNSAEGRLDWPTFSYAELQRRCILGPHPMWRRSLHEKWGWFDTEFKIAGDYEFWLRVGKSERIDRYPATLGLYFQNPQGLEHGSGATMRETLEIQRRYGELATPKASILPPTQALAPVQQTIAVDNTKKSPAVSVIVPTYNRPDFLCRALQSLCVQTFRDFEVIVINDCGDPLEAIVDPFCKQLDLSYIRHGSNRDRAAARNTGIRAARGKYMAYLDDDDSYRPDHLKLIVDAIRKAGCCVGYSEAVWVQERKTANGYETYGVPRSYRTQFDIDQIMVTNYIPILSLIHERSCLDEVGMFDETLGTHEDWDLFIRLAYRYRFVQIPVITADISVRDDGSSTTSGNRPDFVRTLKLIHERYHHLVSDRPEILAAQARALQSLSRTQPAAPVQPMEEVDVYDKAYQWGWEHPSFKEIVYHCYKTPNFADNARRFFESGEFKGEIATLSQLGQGPCVGKTLLDVGCGNGVACYALARSGYTVHGIDSSNGALAGVRAAQKLQGLDGVTFTIECTKATTLNFPDNHFDVVWMREVLHHIKDLSSFLKEVYRVLKPGGILCCFRDTVIWNEDQRKHFFDNHPFYHITNDEGAYYLHEYQEAFRSAGLHTERELNPLESVINTFPGPALTGAVFDPAASTARRTGYDLFSFFQRKPLAAYNLEAPDALIDAAIARFKASKAAIVPSTLSAAR
jgi:glycosyltransferase involved in cell wall biosynthesis